MNFLSLSPSFFWLAALTVATVPVLVPQAQAVVVEPPTPNVERIEYMDTFEEEGGENPTTLVGFLAMPPAAASSSPLPALVIIPYVCVVAVYTYRQYSSGVSDLYFFSHVIGISLTHIHDASFCLSHQQRSDWDGVNEYEQQRVTLAATDLGYVSMVADIYGYEGTVENITERSDLATYYRSEQPERFIQRIQVAIDYIAALPQVNANQIAIAGYCFGGSGVLMYAVDDSGIRQSNAAAAVISFHGGLSAVLEHHNPNTTSIDRPR